MNVERLKTAVQKEWTERLRSRSIFAVAWILPVFLIMLFGFGMSMDVDHVKVAVVLEDEAGAGRIVLDKLQGSGYIDAEVYKSRSEADEALRLNEVKATAVIPSDFTKKMMLGRGEIGISVDGSDSSEAMIVRTYLKAAAAAAAADPRMPRVRSDSTAGAIVLNQRYFFNEANDSAWYLVPGMMIVVTTLIASFCSSIVVAREFEEGTLEALMLTPSRPSEWLAAKALVDLFIVSIGIAFMTAAAFIVFELPLRGSPAALALNMLIYASWSSCAGLFISSVMKRQFLAVQTALIASYLPALLLSGFLFDLRSVPDWIGVVGRLLPPTYAIETVKIIFLSGADDGILWWTTARNAAILILWSMGLFAASCFILRKTSRSR